MRKTKFQGRLKCQSANEKEDVYICAYFVQMNKTPLSLTLYTHNKSLMLFLRLVPL